MNPLGDELILMNSHLRLTRLDGHLREAVCMVVV
jgi:hypothetical protein